MPIHNWTTVEAGIFYAFHHRWISALSDTLNIDRLPAEYYALPEQVAAGFGPDILTLHAPLRDTRPATDSPGAGAIAVLQSRPRARFSAETEAEFYRRKMSSIVVRHVSGDRIVAMIEILSPGNKSTQHAFQAFVDNVCQLLENRIHLLIVDPFPPSPRDPNGVHAAIWGQIQDDPFHPPADEPLTLVAYECDLTTRASIETVAVGAVLPDMPLFLQPNGCVMVPLEATYQSAFAVMPKRWRVVLQPAAPV
ncbi:MAG: DUF4058 family protein [Planctomycetes bacterium]|nr:DUF4058 family protein [Planctomycetota bacterium]